MHQRAVKREQGALADNIGVVAEHAGTAVACRKVNDIHCRPGKMKVHQIGLLRCLRE